MYDRIRYFLKAAETGSFTKAANQMFISPQALTKQIAKLEDEIGGRLFERSSKGIKLTVLGVYAREQFSEADRVVNRAVNNLREYALNLKKRINVGFFSALPKEEMITPIVSYMILNYPEYHIGFELIEMSEGREKLETGKIDLLLTNTNIEESWEGFRCFAFCKTDAKVIVSVNHPWATRKEISFDDMKKMTFLKLSIPDAKIINEKNESFYNNIPCKDEYDVPNFMTLLELLKQGRSFAVAPLMFSDVDKENIISFEYPGDPVSFYTALIYNTHIERKDIKMIAENLAKVFEFSEIKNYMRER